MPCVLDVPDSTPPHPHFHFSDERTVARGGISRGVQHVTRPDDRVRAMFPDRHATISRHDHPFSKNPILNPRSNACVVPPLPRPGRQESANTTTETFRAGNYAKIAERGCGQYQRFVRIALYITPCYLL